MARLIPSFTDDRTPPGERDVFNLLSGGPDDWMVLHSLDLAPWNNGLRTEIDFVIVVPDTGILCAEVKSHEKISFDGYRWSPGTINRSPFKQAADGRYTFYRRLKELAPQFRRIPVVHCCIFPRATFHLTPNLSVQPWELIDLRLFRSFRSGIALCADLKVRIEKSIASDENIKELTTKLSKDQIETIAGYCVPVQKSRPDLREEIKRRELEIENTLLDQQKPVLRLATLNDRLIVSGAAGTGKTLIAMEVARRRAEQGFRVALLCFNQLVGDWMNQKLQQSPAPLPNLIVGRTIRVLARMTGVLIPDLTSATYWERELPEQLEDCLTNPDFKANAAFDYLVLDEAQDILARPSLWYCLTQFLSGGLRDGSFALFGDFDYQVLNDREQMQNEILALELHNRPVHWELSENCRNYRIVGDTAVRLSGLGDSVYSGYLRAGGGVDNYNIFFYDNDKTQLDKLREWLREFKSQGYKPSEITILSLCADEMSAASSLKNAGYKLRPAWMCKDLTGYASIHAFKGMENKVIILTDVVLGDQDFKRDLFYTGLTRCTEIVRVLCNTDSQETLTRWLTGGPDI